MPSVYASALLPHRAQRTASEYVGPVPRKRLSPTYAPVQRALCACPGCSPFALDDGVRARTVVLSSDPSAFVGNLRRRATLVTALVAAERAATRAYTCRRCGAPGHPSNRCRAPEPVASAARELARGDGDLRDVRAGLDAKIAELTAKVAALQKARAALAE